MNKSATFLLPELDSPKPVDPASDAQPVARKFHQPLGPDFQSITTLVQLLAQVLRRFWLLLACVWLGASTLALAMVYQSGWHSTHTYTLLPSQDVELEQLNQLTSPKGWMSFVPLEARQVAPDNMGFRLLNPNVLFQKLGYLMSEHAKQNAEAEDHSVRVSMNPHATNKPIIVTIRSAAFHENANDHFQSLINVAELEVNHWVRERFIAQADKTLIVLEEEIRLRKALLKETTGTLHRQILSEIQMIKKQIQASETSRSRMPSIIPYQTIGTETKHPSMPLLGLIALLIGITMTLFTGALLMWVKHHKSAAHP